MKNIKIITDGSCDLSQEIIDKSQVDIVDVMVSFGDKSYSTRSIFEIPFVSSVVSADVFLIFRCL